jgi:hypothetical protein
MGIATSKAQETQCQDPLVPKETCGSAEKELLWQYSPVDALQ